MKIIKAGVIFEFKFLYANKTVVDHRQTQLQKVRRPVICIISKHNLPKIGLIEMTLQAFFIFEYL